MRRISHYPSWLKRPARFFSRYGWIIIIVGLFLLTIGLTVNRSTDEARPVKPKIKTQVALYKPTTTSTTTLATTTTTTTLPPQTTTTAPPTPIAPEGEIQQYIHDQALAHGLDPTRMLRIAKCESGFRPDAINRDYYAGGGHPSGIYQYLPETWNRISSRSGLGVGNVFDWQQNVRVTMWAYVNGYAGEWACK